MEGKREEQEVSTRKSVRGETSDTGTRFSAEEIHGNVVEAAEEEMERPFAELSLSGLAAGLAIGFSFLAVALVSSHMAPGNQSIAAAISYPVGFVYVVLAAHQLFTENTLEPVLPLLEQRTGESLRKLVRLWAIVLPANLVGAAIFALVIARTPSVDPALKEPLLRLAREATSGGAEAVFIKAIWAGWLIALMAWLLGATKDTTAQIILIWITTGAIAGLGFKHSIAGATDAFYRVWLGDVGFMDEMFSFELPALVGNIIGGVVLVAMVNHGQAGGGKAK
jgi:formate/nitrite transporter FocA (FNT family)